MGEEKKKRRRQKTRKVGNTDIKKRQEVEGETAENCELNEL